ncbi:hypothetical protein QJQ45_021287, partial [Haematococcus lacustris]
PGFKARTGPGRPGGAGGWQPGAAPLMVFAPKDLANLAWSFATAGRYDSALFDLLCSQAQASLADFTPRDISNLLWACATCRHPCPALLHTSIPAITTLRHAFTPQALANTLWAHACLGSHSPALFTPLAQQAHRLAPRLLPQHLSQIAWAMATAGQAHCAFLEAAISLALQPQLSWTTGELARFLWALAVMEAGSADVMLHLASQLLNQLQRRLEGRGRSTPPATEPGPTAHPPAALPPGPGLGIDLANAVWALAWSGNYSQPLFQQAAALCSQHPTVLFARPADMASILWPFGFARHYDPPLYCAAAALLAQPPARHGLSLGQQAALLLPLAKLRHLCPSACQQVAASLQACLAQQPGSVRFSTLCSLLWSLMLLGHSDVALLRLAFARVAVLWERQLGLEAVQQLREDEAISRGLMPELNQAKKLEAAPRHIAQLFHVYLWLKDQADPELVQVADSLPPSLIERACRAWQREAEKDSVVSQGQYRVLQALQDMGFRPHLESMTSDGLFSIDLCLQLEGRQLAIEYNGPWHYSASSPCRLTGSKLLRNAFLARRGYLVSRVALYCEAARRQKRKILAHLQQRPEVHSQLRVIASLFVSRIFLTCIIDPGIPMRPNTSSAASSAGTSLEAKLKNITVTLATWGAVWKVYLDPKWARQRLRLYGAQYRALEQFLKQKDMAEVFMERHGRAKQMVVFSGAAGIGTRRGWTLSQRRDQPVRGMMWCPVVAPRKPPQAPCSSQAATQPAASEPGPSTPPPAERSKRTKAEPHQPTKGKGKGLGKAAKAKPAPQPGRWLDRDCNAALNMQRIGESRWRPLEMCSWPEQGKLPAKGKEYPGLGYKRLRDKPHKAQEQQQQHQHPAQISTMSGGKWQRLTREDEARTPDAVGVRYTQEELGRAADPNSQDQQELVREMKEHLKKKNFGRPVEWALVQDHPWSTPQLRKLDTPVDVEGKPWKE